MNLLTALLIKDLRRSHTWRALAREIAKIFPDANYLAGNQIEGTELDTEAFAYLYPEEYKTIHETGFDQDWVEWNLNSEVIRQRIEEEKNGSNK